MDKSFPLSGWGSVAVHAGHKQDPNYAHLVPIYASSTFVFDEAEQGMRRFSGQEEGYIYSRWGNPTFTEAENKIAALETFGIKKNGLALEAKGILHASGMAAITTLLLSTLKPGDKILTHYSLYGGTEEIMSKVLPSLGITAIIADLRNINNAVDAIKKDKAIKMLYIETPANPTIQCVDIEQLCELAKQNGLLTACDNTFATPYLQQPFQFGVDFIVHSTTKFLNGHGTAIGGILLGTDLDFMKNRVSKMAKTLGGNANPFDAFLLINGMKTLELRMDRHCANAMKVASFLETHPAVAKVNYTGLASHPDHAVAMKQMRHPGAMLSFELKSGFQGGINFMNKLQMCTRTVSLGTCDSLLSHPASMTHYSVPKEEKEKYGITDGLIRMNVGIENLTDIIADLDQALKN
ncbi:MAG: aminotransferase class I/II-fold pyridoxal phosphate-dependent enzyme [Chitinophagaceae bacterium]|nr:aminotransferase class I/II-fold pyridoxal phosphate-dependent enzyme [Chitinophagaceae bacterium]HQX95833.1 aminotransferase class I/II-fold pyridoxal phosphate-dependent enzyme [Chitinophagaceae bacterium]HQZ50656.1 aminotransferase class I/II-fold pyridoxal phosphate-dependent enzyme [Chitinophagaceae bacterium]HRA10988.1 aminotransferase class I/II-fold pyridoxal phosphate-dependent enzyme [Chitinophagaceae bacterium]